MLGRNLQTLLLFQDVVDKAYECCAVNAKDCCARPPTTSVGTLSRVRRRFDPFGQLRGCFVQQRSSRLLCALCYSDSCAMRCTASRQVRVSVTSRVVILLAFATCLAAAGHTSQSADPFVSVNIGSRAPAKCVETSDEQAMPAMTLEFASFATGVSPLRPRRNAVAQPSPFEPATCRATEPPFQAERDGEGAMAEGLQKRWQGESKDAPQCKCEEVRC